ncbi:tetratricopeptide repeat protein [Roseateles asaccharophilus]|uniref:TPR repeat protein n=1 Tax=Roseateles asaccharophilus TaxID=582607 RepID=A0ABU2A3C6_9BURK|nr:tetratricopeptide repeat protein [Roseateles asaccharophilus]MDR7331695.1 TPR repeat protein [Roseateles asaccharophilus]
MTGIAHPSFMKNRVARAGLAFTLALAAHAAGAQQAEADKLAAAATQSLGAVKITGQRNGGVDPSVVIAAKNKILSRQYASSCGFLSGYSAADDDVTLAYLRDFGMLDNPSNEVERISDLSPDGNAKTATVGSAVSEFTSGTQPTSDVQSPAVACGVGDKRFAAGRNWIARKDKSLTQAFEAYEAGNFVDARTKFEEGWKKLGYEEAAMMLGRIHLLGLGTPASTPKAIAWLREVVDARYDPVKDRLKFDPAKPDTINTRVEASLLLARIHLTGQGTKRDPVEAYKWWNKALDYGFEPAGTLLGQASLSGVGTKQDPKRALDYLQAAGEAGDVTALYMLGQLYHHQMPKQPEGVPLDLKRAGAYYGAAAKAGNLDATYAAARMLDRGEGLSAPAPERAVVFYKEAALKGHVEAQNALATFFYSGEVVPQNFATARQLFQAAARGRQPDAMFNLAVMLAQGQGGDKDMAAAYAWCTLAKGQGHEQAATALPAIAAKLSPEDKARAEAMLKPAPKKS